MGNAASILVRAHEIAEHRTPQLDKNELQTFVQRFHRQKDSFLELTKQHGSPLYVLDEKALLKRASDFSEAFEQVLDDVRVYYAVKSNNHPRIAELLVNAGLGLDVSSGDELELALKAGADKIIFSGPAKSESELALAVAHADRVTVLMDSVAELERLEKVAAGAKREIRTGVRLTVDDNGIWRKFGIPLANLRLYLSRAARCSYVKLRGLQFHVSWNLSPDNQVVFIARLGAALRELDKKQRSMIEFIDVGGGFWPPRGEWMQEAATPEGKLRHAVMEHARPKPEHYRWPAAPIEVFAEHIATALKKQILRDIPCMIYAEPGRWISHEAMHMLVTVADRKLDDLVITDGGTNAIGWDRFELDYFPVINLSRPSLTEHECYVMGSLCTPHDLWGYSYFGEDIQAGDVLLIPTQGSYTYSLRQHFIKAVPPVVSLTDGMLVTGQSSHSKTVCSEQTS
ncbi:alanine racemase [bacterium]|nr:alanine racemase [bacterium]